MKSNNHSEFEAPRNDEVSEEDKTFLLELVLRGYKNSIDEAIQETIEETIKKTMEEHKEKIQKEKEDIKTSSQLKINEMIDENEKLKKEIVSLKIKTDITFKEVQELMIQNSVQLKDEESLIHEAQESLDKEKLRSELINIELAEYQDEYDKLLDNNVNSDQIIQISLDHCLKQSQKLIPDFHEKYPDVNSTDFATCTTKLSKILKEEAILLHSKSIEQLHSLHSNAETSKLSSCCHSLSSLQKLMCLNQTKNPNIFDILRSIKADPEIQREIQNEINEDVGVILNYNLSELTEKEKDIIDELFQKLVMIAKVSKNKVKWEEYRNYIRQKIKEEGKENGGCTWEEKVKVIMDLDMGQEMDVEGEPDANDLMRVYNLLIE